MDKIHWQPKWFNRLPSIMLVGLLAAVSKLVNDATVPMFLSSESHSLPSRCPTWNWRINCTTIIYLMSIVCGIPRVFLLLLLFHWSKTLLLRYFFFAHFQLDEGED